MVSPVLLHKEHKDLPDFYGVKIKYLSGHMEQFDIASHIFTKESGLFEFWTHSDARLHWVVMSSVERIEFDEKFTKVCEIKRQHDRDQLAGKDDGLNRHLSCD